VFTPEKVQEVISAGIKFFGIDYRPQPSPDLIPGKVYVVKADIGIAIPVDMYINTALKTIQQVITPQTTIAYQTVNLANTQATEYKYEMKVSTPDGATLVRQVVQYVVVDGSTVYVISMHCPAETAPMYLPEFEQIAKTFELIE